MSYKKFPPLQAPETYNLDGILKQSRSERGPRERLACKRARRPADAPRGVCHTVQAMSTLRLAALVAERTPI